MRSIELRLDRSNWLSFLEIDKFEIFMGDIYGKRTKVVVSGTAVDRINHLNKNKSVRSIEE